MHRAPAQPPTRPQRGPGGRTGVRGVLAGGTCAVGAMTAHATAGGEVTALAALAATALSVALAPALLGRTVDPVRTLALSLACQVLWHVVFLATAAGTATSMAEHDGHGGSPAAMAALHLVAAALAAAAAVGAERLLVTAARWLAGVLLPAVPAAVEPPAVDRTEAPAAPLPTSRAAAYDVTRPRRGPPVAPALG